MATQEDRSKSCLGSDSSGLEVTRKGKNKGKSCGLRDVKETASAWGGDSVHLVPRKLLFLREQSPLLLRKFFYQACDPGTGVTQFP